MGDTAIKVADVSKLYKLGNKNVGSFRYDIITSVKGLFNREKEDDGVDLWALKDVSFELKKGEALAVVGQNGSGKSTLLKLLSRITEPTTGRIDIYGRVSSLLEVGTGFHHELSGRENIFLNGTILGMTKQEIRSKFDEIVDFSGIEKFIDTPVKRYSSGMYVRLAFAVAAHLEPEILIVDEVLAVGDSEFQKKCIGKMKDVTGQGRTILFVSHNMPIVQSLCTKAIILNKGRKIGDGDVKEQIENYYTAINEKIKDDSSVQLNDDIELTSFSFSPNPIETRSDLKFKLSLQVKTKMNISGLSLLIYTFDEIRVAIIDLRKANGIYNVEKNKPLTIQGIIKELALVEGSYYIGLLLETDKYKRNFFYRLREIEVYGTSLNKGVIPYWPKDRGYVEFDYEFSHDNNYLE